MAQRRMISLKVTDTDAFIEMSLSARYLYLEFCTRADDDGFIGAPKKIQRMVGCTDNDYKELMGKQFIIPFDSGICVIKHWRIHNYIRLDRYTETLYKNEKSMLLEDNNTYIKQGHDVPQVDKMSYQRVTQVRLGKDKLNKDNNIEQQVARLWSSYPNKKGKDKAIKKLPKLINEYTYAQLERCITRYKQEIVAKGTAKEYIKHGSTFFNGAFIDYLDENYSEVNSTADLKSISGFAMNHYQDDELPF